MKFNLAILKNESPDEHLPWVAACEEKKDLINYKIIDLTQHDWFERINEENFDFFLCRPSDKTGYFKQMYDERLYIINVILNKMIYPSYEEIIIYENKRMLSNWLKANNIPHPKTEIFYHKEKAKNFAQNCDFPVVAKTSIGASGSGVVIIKSKGALNKYIDRAFSLKGIKRQWGINLRKENLNKRGMNALKDLKYFFKKIERRFRAARSDPHRWHVIFQEYIKCDYEWRAVKIGDSYFAHKKLKTKGDKFSGTSKVSWDGPSIELLNFVKMVCDKRNFLSQAVDVFEPNEGIFYVNELQCFFGSRNPHQMILNGKPGRYIFKNNKWIFEEGSFNSNNSYDLRLSHIIQLLQQKNSLNL